MSRGTKNVMAGAESRYEPVLSWRELKSISPLARSLFLLHLTDRVCTRPPSGTMLVLNLFHAQPCFLQELPPSTGTASPISGISTGFG